MIQGQAEPLSTWEVFFLDAAVNQDASSGTIAITGANSAVGKALLEQVASGDTLSAVALVRRGGGTGEPSAARRASCPAS